MKEVMRGCKNIPLDLRPVREKRSTVRHFLHGVHRVLAVPFYLHWTYLIAQASRCAARESVYILQEPGWHLHISVSEVRRNHHGLSSMAAMIYKGFGHRDKCLVAPLPLDIVMMGQARNSKPPNITVLYD
jgi:hypothetical protein